MPPPGPLDSAESSEDCESRRPVVITYWRDTLFEKVPCLGGMRLGEAMSGGAEGIRSMSRRKSLSFVAKESGLHPSLTKRNAGRLFELYAVVISSSVMIPNERLSHAAPSKVLYSLV